MKTAAEREARRKQREEERAGQCQAPHQWGSFSLKCVKPKNHEGQHYAAGIKW